MHGTSSHSDDAENELKRQYSQAEDFLIGLADRFLGGVRDRVVILPENHDVNFNDVVMSLRKIEIPVEPERKKRLVTELHKPRSKMRWSWNDFFLGRFPSLVTNLFFLQCYP